MAQNRVQKARERLAKRRADELIPRRRLLPWQMAFAEWLALHPLARVSKETQLDKANELLTKTGFDGDEQITADELETLKRRVVFREYRDEVGKTSLNAARRMLRERYPFYVEAHWDGLQMAQKAKDYQAIPKYTTPILDRVEPKQVDAGAQTAVAVSISVKAADLIAREAPVEADYEVVEVEEAPSG